MSINDLFNIAPDATTTSSHMLPGSAELTHLAARSAGNMLELMNSSIDQYRDRIKASLTDSNALNALVDELAQYDESKAEFLKDLDDDTIQNILRSQMSKRSHCKGKAMTPTNYRNLLTAAIAEHILRKTLGLEASTGRRGGRARSLDYSVERLTELAADQDALRKEIRNLQSRKSIMKARADFDPESEAWQELLKAEETVKALRTTPSTPVVRVDETRDKLSDLLADTDLEHMNKASMQALINSVIELAGC